MFSGLTRLENDRPDRIWIDRLTVGTDEDCLKTCKQFSYSVGHFELT